MSTAITDKASRIKLAIFDVDGVLTDGSLILGNNGEEFKTFHAHDGLGLVLLKESGIQVAVITARDSAIVAARMKALGIEYVYQGQQDKRIAFNDLINRLGLKAEHVAYTGDDLIDLPVMRNVGLPIAVANAHTLVKETALWTTHLCGGQGAVREICERLLGAQGKFEQAIAKYTTD